MKNETLGALELSMSVMIFATVIYLLVALYVGSTPGALPEYNATIVLPATNLTDCGIGIPVLDWGICLADFLSWLLSSVWAVLVFLAQTLVFIFQIGYTIFLFGFIWTGALAFPYPANFLLGIPLTSMGLFILIEMIRRVLAMLPLWSGPK